MARVDKGSILKDLKGTIGKQIVFKQYSYGTVVSQYPDMSRVKHTELQKAKQSVFSQAVAYAQSILRDPEKKAAYQKKVKKGSSVYHTAIKEFLQKNE